MGGIEKLARTSRNVLGKRSNIFCPQKILPSFSPFPVFPLSRCQLLTRPVSTDSTYCSSYGACSQRRLTMQPTTKATSPPPGEPLACARRASHSCMCRVPRFKRCVRLMHLHRTPRIGRYQLFLVWLVPLLYFISSLGANGTINENFKRLNVAGTLLFFFFLLLFFYSSFFLLFLGCLIARP